MSKYADRRHEIDFKAPVKWVTGLDFEDLWVRLEAVDRFGNGELAKTGIEAIWDFDNRCWVAVDPERAGDWGGTAHED